MIQVHGKTILLMEFKSIIKAQFSLKLLYQKRKEPKTIKAWQRKKYHVTEARKAHWKYLRRNPKKKKCVTNKSP